MRPLSEGLRGYSCLNCGLRTDEFYVKIGTWCALPLCQDNPLCSQQAPMHHQRAKPHRMPLTQWSLCAVSSIQKFDDVNQYFFWQAL